MPKFVLTTDITAAELAVDSPDDDGYRPWDVIGDAGTPITIVETRDGYTGMVEVTGFSRDPFVFAFIHESLLREV